MIPGIPLKKPELQITEIHRIVSLIQKVNCSTFALITETASEMGIKKTALMQFIEDNPKNFNIQEITSTSTKGVKRSLGLGIKRVYLTAEENPSTEEWMNLQKTKWNHKLHVGEQTYYGQHEFFYFPVEDKKSKEAAYRNTPEKFQELEEMGILKKSTEGYGGLSDYFTSDVYLCNSDILQKLTDAGWTTDWEEVVAKYNSK